MYNTTIQTAIRVIISPSVTPSQPLTRNYNITINPTLINVNISQPLIASALQFLQTAIDNYVDEERTLKTLLNYG